MSTQISNNLINQYTTQKPAKKKFTDKFQTGLRNSADMNDCISVPRTIFKGYLGIMFGTTLAAGANLIKSPSKIKTALNVAALGLSAYGTWSFARPYVLKDAVPTVKAENNKN